MSNSGLIPELAEIADRHIRGAHLAIPEAAPLVGEWVRTTLGKRSEVNRTSRRSIVHRNGFIKIPVLTDEETSPSWAKAVLHIWPERVGRQAEEPHNHRWDYASFVLMGSLQTTTFVESTSGDGVPFHSYSYSSPGETSTFQLHHQGPSYLIPAGGAHLSAGDFHWARHEQIHRVHVEPAFYAATLFLQSAVRSESSSVFLEADHGSQFMISRNVDRPSPDALGAVMKRLADL